MKDFLLKTFLFRGVRNDIVEKIIEDSPPVGLDFKRGEVVYPLPSVEKMVGFILEGRCEIRRTRPDGGRIVLNVLNESDSFGILSVFSKEEFPTQIFASKNSRIIFFGEKQILNFVNNYSQISTNLIVFLANRIDFLNKKIATFSGNRVEERLSAFLLCERSRFNSDSFPLNCQKTSEEINAGRASVYRALATLQNEGLINVVDKKIYILDQNGLERNVK